jgi:hypothetical protein
MNKNLEEAKNRIEVYLLELNKIAPDEETREKLRRGRLDIRKYSQIGKPRKELKEILYKLNIQELRELQSSYSDIEIKGIIEYVSEVKNNIFYRIGLVPKYTETSLFFVSVTFLTLLFLSNEMFDKFFNLVTGSPKSLGLGVAALVGIPMSIYSVFSKKKIPWIMKSIILLYAVFVNGLAAMYAIYHIIFNHISNGGSPYVLILPIINILSALIIIAWVGRGDSDIWAIDDKNASLIEIIIGFIIVSMIIIVSHYILHNYWAITFSLATIYSTNLSSFIHKALVKL